LAGALSPNSETDSSQLTKLAKVVKLTRLLRLMRMLRLYKLSVMWERIEGRIGSITALNVVSLLKVLGVWAAICHWGACLWWMVGKRDSLMMILTFQDDDPEGLHWTELPRVHSTHDGFGYWTWLEKPASEQYVFCFYWILGVMRTMPAEVTPVNLIERVFTLLFMFFAIMAFAINVARLTQAWFKFSARKDAFKEEMAYVRMHLRTTKCRTSLQLRTQAYLRHLFETRRLHAKELGLLSTLPEELKRDMAQTLRIPFLRMMVRLRDWTDPMLRAVCDATQTVDVLTGDRITEKCSEAEAAYVVMSGGLQVFEVYTSNEASSRTSITSMLGSLSLSSNRAAAPLTVVDEHCLFDVGANVLCKNTVVAMECSEVLRVDRQRFQQVLRQRRDGDPELCHGKDSNQFKRRASTDSMLGNRRRSRHSVAWQSIVTRLGIPGASG